LIKFKNPESEVRYMILRSKNIMDEYGAGIIGYMERWAILMEAHISKGEKIQDIWMKTSHQADIDGITGFMFGMAVTVLSEYWIYGDDLKICHNTAMGYPKAKGVINPAVVVVNIP